MIAQQHRAVKLLYRKKRCSESNSSFANGYGGRIIRYIVIVLLTSVASHTLYIYIFMLENGIFVLKTTKFERDHGDAKCMTSYNFWIYIRCRHLDPNYDFVRTIQKLNIRSLVLSPSACHTCTHKLCKDPTKNISQSIL